MYNQNRNYILIFIIMSLVACTSKQSNYVEDSSFAEICKNLPVAANEELPLSNASDDWFQVYESYAVSYTHLRAHET